MFIAVVNQKGGVGKTTTALNVGAALARAGRSVLLLDLDPQHNLTLLCGQREIGASLFEVLTQTEGEGREAAMRALIRPTKIENLHLAPGAAQLAGLESALHSTVGREFLLREAVEPLRERFDFFVADTPPTLGLGPMMALVAADLALVPLQCEELAIVGLAQLQKTLEELRRRRINPQLKSRVLLTMLMAQTTHGRAIAAQARASLGDQVLKTEIRRSADLARGALKNGAVVSHAPNSASAQSYGAVAQEILALQGR